MTVAGYPLWALLVVCAGIFLSGFVDAIGGGGGLISLPAYLFVGLPTHFALGTNKLSSCIGTAVSTGRYIKKGYVNWALALPSIALAIIGAWCGTRLQLTVSDKYLRFVLIPVLIAVACVMIKKKELPEEAGDIGKGRQRLIVWTAALIIGMYDGFYGPGTGTFMLLAYTKLAKLGLRTSAGNVKVVNLASNTAAMLTSLAAGTVVIKLGLIAACFSVAGHYVGSGLMIKNGSKVVTPVILTVLGLLLIKLVLESFGIKI